MNTTFEWKRKSIFEEIKHSWEVVRNILKFAHRTKSKHAVQAHSAWAILRDRFTQLQEKETAIAKSIERFFHAQHQNETYSLCFLSYHLLFQKLLQMSKEITSQEKQTEAARLAYLNEQIKEIESFFMHTKEEADTLHFWGKELLHEIVALLNLQVQQKKLV